MTASPVHYVPALKKKKKHMAQIFSSLLFLFVCLVKRNQNLTSMVSQEIAKSFFYQCVTFQSQKANQQTQSDTITVEYTL